MSPREFVKHTKCGLSVNNNILVGNNNSALIALRYNYYKYFSMTRHRLFNFKNSLLNSNNSDFSCTVLLLYALCVVCNSAGSSEQWFNGQYTPVHHVYPPPNFILTTCTLNENRGVRVHEQYVLT